MSLPAEKVAVPRVRPAAATRRAGGLNLSHRPFLNTRPVTRVSALLWILGLLLLLGNVSLFWSYLSGSAEKRAELEELKQETERQERTAGQLEKQLALMELDQQNRQVRFLNGAIRERTFSWSLLFDRLGEAMPDEVRLNRLSPRPLGKRPTGRQEEEAEPLDDRVLLIINGVAKSDEALDSFVDRLFAHESFDQPDYSRTSRDEESGLVEFDLRVTYIPGDRSAGEIVLEEAAPPSPEILPEILEAPPAAAPATPPGAGSEIDG